MIKLPPIGNRIIKTTIAVFVCMFIFTLGHVERSPFYVLITTIICIQPDMKNEKLTAINRALGTLINYRKKNFINICVIGLKKIILMEWTY